MAKSKSEVTPLAEVYASINRAWGAMPYGGMICPIGHIRDADSPLVALSQTARNLEKLITVLQGVAERSREQNAEVQKLHRIADGFEALADLIAANKTTQ